MDSITGEHYILGLYHGEESGHLMLYMNENIFLIDYHILDSKFYQFYIGNEFMKLDIKKVNNGFEYSLKVDTESPTPLNQAYKKNRINDEKLLLFGLVFISIILAGLFIYNYYARYRH